MDLDLSRSTLTLRTRARGFLSALAHDLELSATFARGTAQREGDRWEGEVAVAPSAIRVVGVLRGGRVARDVLSASDVRDIERRIVDEIFAGVREIVAVGRGTVASPELRISARREAEVRPTLGLRDDVISGRGAVSMRALGLAEVKGPLGAFAIKDDVEFEVELSFR